MSNGRVLIRGLNPRGEAQAAPLALPAHESTPWYALPTMVRTQGLSNPGGTITATVGTGGSMSAASYNIVVFAVDILGNEGIKSATKTFTISAGQAAAGASVTITWPAVPTASRYHVYVYTAAQGSTLGCRYYDARVLTLTITADPASPPTGLAAVAGVVGSLIAGPYNFWVSAIFGDGETNLSGQATGDPEEVWIEIAAVNSGTGSIALTWDAVTGAIGYRVYFGGQFDGGTRPAFQYIETTTNSLVYTGQAGIRRNTFGNEDMCAAGLGVFSAIRTYANAKSIFGGDIQINSMNNSGATFIARRARIAASLFAGLDLRTGGKMYWQIGVGASTGVTNNLEIYQGQAPGALASLRAYIKQTTGDWYFQTQNDDTNIIAYPLRFERLSSALVANGFGVGIGVDMEAADGLLYGCGGLQSAWADATNKISAWELLPRSVSGNFPRVLVVRGDGNVCINNQGVVGASAQGVVSLGNADAAPTGSIANGIQLWAEDVVGLSELKIRNEAGYVSVITNLRYILYRVLASTTDHTVSTIVGGDFELSFTGTLVEIGAYVDTAGVTGVGTIDVNLNGTTLMSATKITIDSAEKSSRTAATPPVLTTTAVTAGDIITADIDGIQTTAAKGLTIRLGIRQT